MGRLRPVDSDPALASSPHRLRGRHSSLTIDPCSLRPAPALPAQELHRWVSRSHFSWFCPPVGVANLQCSPFSLNVILIRWEVSRRAAIPGGIAEWLCPDGSCWLTWVATSRSKVGVLGRHVEGTSLAFLLPRALKVSVLGQGQPWGFRGAFLTGHQHLSFPTFQIRTLLWVNAQPWFWEFQQRPCYYLLLSGGLGKPRA